MSTHRGDFLKEFEALLVKYKASIVVTCSEYALVEINVSGNTGEKFETLVPGVFKLNSKCIKHKFKEG